MPFFTSKSVRAVSAAYTAQGVNFDGTTYFFGTTNTPFTGAVDGTSCLISFWFKMQGNDGATQDLFLNDLGDGLTIIRSNTNLWRITGVSSGAATVFQAVSNTTFTTPDSWHHLLFARNASTPLLYIDGASDVSATTTNAGNVAYSDAGTYSMGASAGAGFKCSLDIADLYIGMNQFLDISSPANLAKFNVGGHPVDLGSDGSTPTGTAPVGYFSGAVATWHVNKGTGGNLFTAAAGALAASSTNP